MASPAKVTVLVPSYNHGRFIRQRLDSIFNQTYQNFELIVIDDCSTDNSDEIIQESLKQHNFKYIRNQKNSGTPFASWESVSTLATGDYIWICESDDVAEPEFLATAMESLECSPQAVLFYCHSWIIDKAGNRTGHTSSYFHDIWLESRWDNNFVSAGLSELADFQIRGQTVPNMSSAVIAADAFKKAYTPFLKRLRLTGDWLFVGSLMSYGAVVFSSRTMSRFREHEVTSRVRVQSARSQAEFMLTKHLLFQRSGAPIRQFAQLMKTDAIRFLHEPASIAELVKELVAISPSASLSLMLKLAASVAMNSEYLGKFHNRYKMSKQG